MAEPRNPRRTFGPVVLAGLVGAGLAAIAGGKPWVHLHGGSTVTASAPITGISLAGSTDAPVVTAFGLVALAAWGVVLVTRGVVRRGVAALAALASVAALVFGIAQAVDHGHDITVDGVTVGTTYTVWPWLALVGALLSLAAAVAGVVFAPAWPEMGRKYDAPTGAPTGPVLRPDDLETADNIDLWKSITEGRDPTADSDE